MVHLAWRTDEGRGRSRQFETNVAGSERVFTAAGQAGVAHLVHVSAFCAYSPGDGAERVGEQAPLEGVETCTYSVDKTQTERSLDRIGEQFPAMRVARVRPALVAQRNAAAAIQRRFFGGLPVLLFWLACLRRLPVLPLPSGMATQFVHADDLAEALYRILEGGADGAYNIAAEPPLDGDHLASLVGGLRLSVPLPAARAITDGARRLGLASSGPSWMDLALHSPLLDTARARSRLSWRPSRGARSVVTELVQGLAAGAGSDSVPLRPRSGTVIDQPTVAPAHPRMCPQD